MQLWLSDRSPAAADFAKNYLLTHPAAGNDVNGNPVKDAIVVHGDDGYFAREQIKFPTDADGRYRLPALERGTIDAPQHPQRSICRENKCARGLR